MQIALYVQLRQVCCGVFIGLPAESLEVLWCGGMVSASLSCMAPRSSIATSPWVGLVLHCWGAGCGEEHQGPSYCFIIDVQVPFCVTEPLLLGWRHLEG